MRETVLTHLQQGNFTAIITILRDNRIFNELLDDSIFKTVFFQNFTNELFSSKGLELTYPAFLLQCHDSDDYAFKFNEVDVQKVLRFLIDKTNEYSYAARLPHYEHSKIIISEHLNRLRVESEKGLVNAKKKKDFIVVEKYSQNTTHASKSIFNSQQEKEFYFACKQVFPSYLIIPNVSLPTIINQNVVKERFPKYFNYFQKASVDMIVVDEDTFIPILFFELDSKTYHDANTEARDNMKDTIFTELGFDLTRITKRSIVVGIKEYVDLLEVLRKDKSL